MGEESQSPPQPTTIGKPIQEQPKTEAELRKFYKDTYNKRYLEERQKFLQEQAIAKATKNARRTFADFIKEMFFFWKKE